ncbi:hypothetical protein [Paenibacillus cellulositrophicus]|uniref:hypothetical protein n=1 Tax=Paenibacillus cellulositrophicus TaxID=562959 RepID=UPI001266FC4E|nr:hypothetical protein [Paenibacillus cellulositrophicus]
MIHVSSSKSHFSNQYFFRADSFYLAFHPGDRSTPGNTRVILDHSLQWVVTPPCFNSAKVTNNLTESKLSRAEKLQYKPDSTCTEESLAGMKQTLFQILLEKIGAKKGVWDW